MRIPGHLRRVLGVRGACRERVGCTVGPPCDLIAIWGPMLNAAGPSEGLLGILSVPQREIT